MAQEQVSAKERLYEVALVGQEIEVIELVNDIETPIWKIILDVQYEPITKQLTYIFTDNTSYVEHEDTILTFKRDVERPRVTAINGRIKK